MSIENNRQNVSEDRQKAAGGDERAENTAPSPDTPAVVGTLHFVFDKLPSPEGSRFIEVEDAAGKSVNAGEWRIRPDGLAELVVRLSPGVNSQPEPVDQVDRGIIANGDRLGAAEARALLAAYDAGCTAIAALSARVEAAEALAAKQREALKAAEHLRAMFVVGEPPSLSLDIDFDEFTDAYAAAESAARALAGSDRT